MDFLLPDDDTVKKMCAEYASCLEKKAETLGYINEAIRHCESGDSAARVAHTCDIKVLFLYIVLFLRYNTRYGTQIYDTDGGVGRIRPARSAFGSLNHLMSNNG